MRSMQRDRERLFWIGIGLALKSSGDLSSERFYSFIGSIGASRFEFEKFFPAFNDFIRVVGDLEAQVRRDEMP